MSATTALPIAQVPLAAKPWTALQTEDMQDPYMAGCICEYHSTAGSRRCLLRYHCSCLRTNCCSFSPASQ